MNIFVIWLVMVIAWNFGYPQATPLEDVVVAVILSLFNIVLKKYLDFNPPVIILQKPFYSYQSG